MSFASSPSCSAKAASRLSHHKEMYKSPCRNVDDNSQSGEPSDSNASPSWRLAYKKRCFDEFKKSRQKLLSKFRNLQVDVNENKPKTVLKDYLEEELQKIMLLEAKTSSSLLSIDEASDIYKQIQQELISELNDQQIEEILRNEDFEQEMVLQNAANNKFHNVCCPVCFKANLKQEFNQVFCPNCNFGYDVQKVKIDLNQLASRLDEAMRNHLCNDVPLFMFRNSELLMLCEKCDFMLSIF